MEANYNISDYIVARKIENGEMLLYEDYESSPVDILSVCVKEKAEKNIQDNMPHSNGRMSEKGSKEMAVILLTETMSDDEKRKHQISKMSEETGIREEKVDALLKLLNI